MYAINALQHKPASTSFDIFLAQHGIGKVKEIVDSYDTMVSAYRSKDKAAELILGYYKNLGIDRTILNGAISHVTKKEGRIIPVGEERDLEAKVKGGDDKKVVPIITANSYDAPRRNAGYKRVRHREDSEVPPKLGQVSVKHAVPTDYRLSRPRMIVLEGRGLKRIAASLAFIYVFNPFSGFVGPTHYEAGGAEPTPLTRVREQRKTLDYYVQQGKEADEAREKARKAEEEAKTRLVASTAAQPASKIAPAKVPTLQDLAKDDENKGPWVYNRAGPWHKQFLSGEVKYDGLPTDGQEWFGYWHTKTELIKDDRGYSVRISPVINPKIKNGYRAWVKLVDGSEYIGPLPTFEGRLSQHQYDTLQRVKNPVAQIRIYKPKQDTRWGRIRNVVASWVYGKKPAKTRAVVAPKPEPPAPAVIEQVPPVKKPVAPAKVLFEPEHLTVPDVTKTFIGGYKGMIPFVPEHLTEPN